MARRIDSIDARILNLLQARGRMKRNQISEEVGLSVPSVSERMRKLEAAGIIEGYHAVVDANRLNYPVTAFIRIIMRNSGSYGHMIEELHQVGEVLEIHSITGEGSHMVKVRTRDTLTLEVLLGRIQAISGVTGTRTSIVLNTYKETRQLMAESATDLDHA